MRPIHFLTEHAELRFRQRAGPQVFDPGSRRLVHVDQIDRARIAAIANAEIARGEAVYGRARMHIATDSVQRFGKFSADDELVAFDDHGWMLRRGAIASFFELGPEVLWELAYPPESLRLVAHQQVCDQFVRNGLLGERVATGDQLDDAFRRVIRSGVAVRSPLAGASRFVGPFEAERLVRGVTRYQEVTVTCDVVPGSHGHIVRAAECRIVRFDASEHASSAGRAPEPEETRSVPEGGLPVLGGSYRVHLANVPRTLAKSTGKAPDWWESHIVRHAERARALSEDGLARYFPMEVERGCPDATLRGFAIESDGARLLETRARTLVFLGQVGARGSGHLLGFAASPLSFRTLQCSGYLQS